MIFRPLTVAACILTLSAPAAFADKVTDAIDKSKSLYTDGNIGKAYNELQVAVSLMGRRLTAAYMKTFPKAPDGWKARRASRNNQSALLAGQGFILNRRYSQDGGRGRITAQLIVDNPMITAMTGVFSNPAMAARMQYDRVTIDGVGEAWVKFEEERKRGEAVLVMQGRIFIKITARNVEERDILVTMIKGWDVAGVKTAAGMN